MTGTNWPGGADFGMLPEDDENLQAEGPCDCKGQVCNGAWGWIWKSQDLGNQMHAGKLWMEPCPQYPTAQMEWDGELGKSLPPAPPGITPKNRNRYLDPQWGGKASVALRQSERQHEKITTAQIESGEHWNLKEPEGKKKGGI